MTNGYRVFMHALYNCVRLDFKAEVCFRQISVDDVVLFLPRDAMHPRY